MHLHSAPAWSIQGRSLEQLKQYTPGPGSYSPSLSKYEVAPSYQIPRSSRSVFSPTRNPGPGSYNISTFLDVPACKFGTSQRNFLNSSGYSPGPGAYLIKSNAIEGPRYTMQGKRIIKSSNVSPGPGHYSKLSEEITRDKSPSFKIPQACRSNYQSIDQVPGPGAYNLTRNDSAPGWRFGTQSREVLTNRDNPGPGSYKIPDTLDHKGFTLRGRRPESAKDSYPGPGSYRVNYEIDKPPSWSIGKSSRTEFGTNRNNSPGPGSYNIKQELSKNASIFGTSARTSIFNAQATPGPGSYNTQRIQNAPAYSIRPRTCTVRADVSPGPGQYNPRISYSEAKWTIGKEAKGIFSSLYKSSSSLGPGYYNLRLDSGPKWTFGTAVRGKHEKNGNPGPGSYNLYSSLSNLPSYARKIT